MPATATHCLQVPTPPPPGSLSGHAAARPRPATAPASDEAKLKVRFYVPPFLPVFPVTGDYWMLHVDTDYQYALVGQPSRKYLWEQNVKVLGALPQATAREIILK